MTSPFLLATRPKQAAALQQNQSPAVANQAQRADSPPPDPRLKWQQVRDDANKKQNEIDSASAISPVANTIPQSDYMDRFGPIKAIGEISAAGQVASSELQRQRAAQAAANALAAAQAAAAQGAYNSSAGFDFGVQNQGGQAGWGSGGAQGVANVLRQAGFTEQEVPIFMAIAKAESGWNPSAVNNSNRNGSVDRGLFQINSVHQGNSWYPSNPNDPLQSAIAAHAIYKSQGLSAWSVYNSGAYKQFLGAAPPIQVTATPSTNGGVFSTATGALRNQVVQASLQVLNIPYVWGGENMRTGVDCSGLVQQVYKQVLGKNLVHSASAQSQNGYVGTRVPSVNQLQPGDLVAFQWAGGYKGAGDVSHIAIYAGNGEIIEAAGGSHGDRRRLTNSSQDRGAIYIHVKFPGE